jgi:hypothetical protein
VLHRIVKRCGAPGGGRRQVTATAQKVLQNRDVPIDSGQEHRHLTYVGSMHQPPICSIENHSAPTFSGGGVDIEPQFLRQELADLEAPHGSRSVKHVSPLVILHTPLVHLFSPSLTSSESHKTKII